VISLIARFDFQLELSNSGFFPNATYNTYKEMKI